MARFGTELLAWHHYGWWSPPCSPRLGRSGRRPVHIYSERHTAKARHLIQDPRVVVHLESAEHVVIVHGRMIDMGRPIDVPEVVHALSIKYNAPDDEPYLPSTDDAFDVLYLLQPERALLWELSDYDASQRRWSLSR